MAKVAIKSRLDKVEVTLRKALKDTQLLRTMAGFLKLRIYQYTKRGYSLAGRRAEGDPEKLKPLSPNYIEYRRRLQKSGKTQSKKGLKGGAKPRDLPKLGEFFSAARSNLTFTGQMLDALKTTVDGISGRATVFVDDTPRTDSDLTNAEVAVKVAKDGRPFLGLDRVGRDRLRRMAIADIRRKLKRR